MADIDADVLFESAPKADFGAFVRFGHVCRVVSGCSLPRSLATDRDRLDLTHELVVRAGR